MRLSNQVNTTMTVRDIAKIAHEINKAFCESIGDNSHAEFDELSDEMKRGTIDGVRHHLSDSNLSPEASHEAWMKNKIDQGWVYGSEKDENKKTHPSLIPYNDLPTTEKSKDYLFRQVVRSLSKFR